MGDNRNSRKKDVPKVLGPITTNTSEPLDDESIGTFKLSKLISK